MKTRLILFFLLTAFLKIPAQITIGSGTSGGFSPLESTFKYSWSAMLYTQAQIGVSGQIYAVGFNQYLSQAGYTMTNQRIYMATTSLTTLTSYTPDTTQMNLVFSGSVTWAGPGWQTISLNTNFNYVNNTNLIIFYCNDFGDSAAPAPVDFYHSYPSFSVNSSKYSMSNTVPPALNSGTSSSALPNTRLYMTPTYDVAVLGIISPTSTTTPGAQNVSIMVKNYSAFPVYSFNLSWNVDTSQVQTFNWSGTLNSGNTTSITVGTYNFTIGDHLITAYTDTPNNLPDYAPYNDTLRPVIVACGGPLNGTYHIGAFPAEFFSFTDAIAALSSCGGVSGPVDFLVDTGSYQERIVIPQIAGASSVNTITFESLSGDSSDTRLWSYSATTNASNYTIKLNGADYIIFKRLKIQTINPLNNHNATYGRNILLTNGATNNSFIGNMFVSDQTGESYNSNCTHICSDTVAANNDSTVIDGNYFYKGTSDVWFDAHTSSFAPGNKIIGNVIKSPSTNGIYLYHQSGVEVSRNSLTMHAISITPKLIVVHDSKNGMLLENNTIKDSSDYGGAAIDLYNIRSDSAHPVFLCNNMAYLHGGSYTYAILSFSVLYCDYVIAWHNTGVETEANPQSSSTNSHAFLAGNFQYLDARNNIFISNNYNPAAMSTSPTPIAAYNDYYTPLAVYNGAPTTAPGVVLVDPDFVSVNDLHLNGHTPANDSLIGYGTPLGVMYDIDGNPRDPLHPTMGADEYAYVPLSADALGNSNDFHVYPNPANDFLFVESGSGIGKQNAIELYDVSGRMIRTTVLENELSKVGLTGLTPGFYFYRIIFDGKAVASGKIVKL